MDQHLEDVLDHIRRALEKARSILQEHLSGEIDVDGSALQLLLEHTWPGNDVELAAVALALDQVDGPHPSVLLLPLDPLDLGPEVPLPALGGGRGRGRLGWLRHRFWRPCRQASAISREPWVVWVDSQPIF